MRKTRQQTQQAMLEAWRAPRSAGDPIGCLATTFTFDAGFFEEECLSRFLEIDSLPDREGLAYLLERENRLGPVYAAVLVDHRQAGVDHSLRWDVLSVRIPRGKQHAKVSLLAWNHLVRIVVGSANLTPHGYRYNYEVASVVDLTPQEADQELLTGATSFLRSLVGFVLGTHGDPVTTRALSFLNRVQQTVKPWVASSKRGNKVSVSLAITLPRGADGAESQSSLDECLNVCRKAGGAPAEVRIASPFFDPMPEGEVDETAAQLCKGMARGTKRSITFCVPSVGESDEAIRLAAPISLWKTAEGRVDQLKVASLPLQDADHNLRPWHAKMMSLSASGYVALMMGSSNFTKAGLGVGGVRNAEANLIYLAKHEAFGREAGIVAGCWPEVTPVNAPLDAEWQGPQNELVEEETASVNPSVPASFVSVAYRPGESPVLVLSLNMDGLPHDWCIHGGSGNDQVPLLDAKTYRERGCPSQIEISWPFGYAPGKLQVNWGAETAFWTVNAIDQSQLPAPREIEDMSYQDLLYILAASDSSAAFRVWAREKEADSAFDEELDSAVPPDLDALRRYRLDATFLHRVRHQARLLAAVKANLERPVWSEQALHWRLTGMIGVERLVQRMAAGLDAPEHDKSETVLSLADLLMMLQEVRYLGSETGVSTDAFESVFENFLQGLTSQLNEKVQSTHGLSREVRHFWTRVCRRTSS